MLFNMSTFGVAFPELRRDSQKSPGDRGGAGEHCASSAQRDAERLAGWRQLLVGLPGLDSLPGSLTGLSSLLGLDGLTVADVATRLSSMIGNLTLGALPGLSLVPGLGELRIADLIAHCVFDW